MNSFLTVDNMKFIINIIQDLFMKKYQYDLNKSSINIKPIFHQIMKKIDSDESNESLSTNEKNKLALSIVKKILIKELSLENTNRENDIYPDRKVMLNEIQSQNTSTIANVTSAFEKLNNLRNKENVKDTPKFEDVHVPTTDASLNELEFKNKLTLLSNQRDTFDMSLQDQRNNDSAVTIKKNSQIDPKEFYSSFDIPTSSNDQPNVIPTNSSSNPFQSSPNVNEYASVDKVDNSENLAIVKTDVLPKSTYIQTKYLLINSLDRNWVRYTNKNKYTVHFTPQTREVVRVPFYENNPTIPFTKSEISEGLPNSSGWYFKGIKYDAFDTNAVLTTAVDENDNPIPLGFEDVRYITNPNKYFSHSFNNIQKIKINNISIPSDVFHSSTINPSANDLIYNYNFNFPYILCNIEEFQDVYDGTDDLIRKCFCQLQYDKFIRNSVGRGFIIFKPVQDEFKFFYPNPLNTIHSLSISLLKPNGELLDSLVDMYTIQSIQRESDYTIVITTQQKFTNNSFFDNDVIMIKNFNVYQTSIGQNIADIDALNSFINRKEGHTILELGLSDTTDNINTLYNCFYIRAPGHFDASSGFVQSTNLTDLLIEVLNAPNGNGALINMSLQNSISLSIDVITPVQK